jgi:hypothetical protein
MCRRFIQPEVFQSRNAAGRVSMAGQLNTHRVPYGHGRARRGLPCFGTRWPVRQRKRRGDVEGKGQYLHATAKAGVRLTSDTPTAAIFRP